MAQLHGSLTPAHADGCGAQCFEGVQRASIFDLPCTSPPAGCHARFAAWCGSLAPRREVMAHRPYGSVQDRMYPSALCCTDGLPSGFLCQGAGHRAERGTRSAPFPDQFRSKSRMAIISFVSSLRRNSSST